MHRSTNVVTILAAAAALACSAPTGQQLPTVDTAAEFCSAYMQGYQARDGACTQSSPATIAQGQAFASEICSNYEKAVTSGRATYDRTVGQSCIADLYAGDCATFGAFEQTLSPACLAALVAGTVTGGRACYSDFDCQSGMCDTQASCPGACFASAGAGQSCNPAPCEAGLACDTYGASPSYVCKTLSGAGGSCPCQGGLWCDESGATPVCRLRQTSGDCSTSNSDQCELPYVCVWTPSALSDTCLPLVGAGGSCAVSPDLCGRGYTCDGNHVCTAPAANGQPCVIGGVDVGCADGWCDALTTHVCQPLKAVGASCTRWDQCSASYCDIFGTGQCQPYRQLGDTCNWLTAPCVSGASCSPYSGTCVSNASLTCSAP